MLSEPTEGMAAWFWKVLVNEVRLKQTDVQLLYVLDEPPENTGARPSAAQLKEAKLTLAAVLAERTTQPKIVVPMGAPVLYLLTGITGESIYDTRGYVINKKLFGNLPVPVWTQYGTYANANKKKGIQKGDPKMKYVTQALAGGFLGMDFEGTVIPTFTLDYIRKSAFSCKPAFVQDMRRVKRILDGQLVLLDDTFSYYTNWTEKVLPDGTTTQATDIRRTEKWGDIIAVDIETHGVNNEAIDCVSFSDGVTTATIPWGVETRDFLNYLFSTHTGYFSFHNSPFDVPRLIRAGVVIPEATRYHRIIDTLYAAVVVQPDLHKGLGRVASLYLDLLPWKWDVLKGNYSQHYSAKDAYVTALLAVVLKATMQKLGQWPLFMGEENHPGPGMMATVPTLIDMSERGIKTDRVWAMQESRRLERRMWRYELMWGRMFPGMNPYSTHEIGNLLYGEWKLPIQRNKKQEDGVSVDELALVRLQLYITYAKNRAPVGIEPWRDDPRCCPRTFDLLLRLRDVSKTLSTYVQPVAMDESACVHPSYLPTPKDRDDDNESHGNTSTGRLATMGPNIQNQPKRVRYMYLPDDPDFVFIQADYKSAELYSIAYMAQDDRLIADLGSDLHQRNADRLNTSRKTAKNVTYAGQYLAGAAKVSEMILKQNHTYIPVEECKRILDGLAEYYWKTTAYKRHISKLCEVKNFVSNPFGRVRFFHDGRAPAAVDFIPQSIVADILWCVLNPAAYVAMKYHGRITTTVHDSILIQVPKAHALAAARELKAAMEKKFDCVAPGFYIPVEVEMAPPGKSWGHVEPCEL